MKNIALKYFAIFREAAGRSTETIQTEARTAAELYEELRVRYNFKLTPEHLRIAANSKFESLDYLLREGDQVVFIPPVAGG